MTIDVIEIGVACAVLAALIVAILMWVFDALFGEEDEDDPEWL